MKKRIIISLILIFAFVLCYSASAYFTIQKQNSRYYALTTIVQTVDSENDTIVIKDSKGNTWTFSGIENWKVNDICSCLMDNKGTTPIYDDSIISTSYGGALLGWIID